MIDKNSVPSAGSPDSAAAREQNHDGLTEAQREFAKVLGEVLAQRWHKDQSRKKGKADSES